MKILVINGPNMNMLGIRQPEIYGHATYEDLKSMIAGEAERLGAEVSFFQSNHEGALVDAIQQAYFDGVEGIILNPAAYTHTSVALLDAVKAVGIPTVVDADPRAGLFLTPRDIDQRIRELGRLLGYGITLALQPSLTAADVTALLG